MSTYSAVIMYAAALPTPDRVTKAASSWGISLRFSPDFRFDTAAPRMVRVSLDGRVAHFEYAFGPLKPLIANGAEPDHLLQHGDVLVSFETRGDDSAIAALHVQRALAELGQGWGWIDGELTPPKQFAEDCRGTVERWPEMTRLIEATAPEREAWSKKAIADEREAQRPRTAREWIQRFLKERWPDVTGWMLAALVLAALLLLRPGT